MRQALILPLALVAACGGDPIIEDPVIRADAGTPTDGAPVPSPDAAVTQSCGQNASYELGSGVREWLPVNDGDTLYLYRGPQGGYMVYLSVRASGFDRDDATLCYELHVVDTGKDAGEGCWNVRLPNHLGGGMYERLGIWGQIDQSLWTRVSQVRGHTLRVDTELTDENGCKMTDGWTVDIHSDPPM
jgi:hypothetical protein